MSSEFNRLHRARFSRRRTIRAAAKEAWDVQERRIDALKAEIERQREIRQANKEMTSEE